MTWEVLWRDGVIPPVPLLLEDETEWLYGSPSAHTETTMEPPSIVSSEDDYWAKRAALLDPDSFAYSRGPSISHTVPAGEVWWLFSGWKLQANGASVGNWSHREPQPIRLPAGFVIQGNGISSSFAYWSTGVGSTRADFFRRMAILETLPVKSQQLEGTTIQSIDSTVDTLMLVGFSHHDVAWGGVNAIHTWHEINDQHPIRAGGPLLLPFKQSMGPGFDQFRTQVSNNVTDAPAASVFLFVELPQDW